MVANNIMEDENTMANKSLFASTVGKLLPRTDAKNKTGSIAYTYSDRHKLAQLIVTGTLNDTFYASAENQLETLIELAGKVDPEFLAKAAIYARQSGYMKDTPALLVAALSVLGPDYFVRTFEAVIDNGKMLRNFVQIMRSGVVARKSLGSRPKRCIAEWLNGASDKAILAASVGQSPSLADVIKMVHPKPDSKEREALYAWIIGKPCDVNLLPQAVKDYISFKENEGGVVPDVPFQMLTALPLKEKHWKRIAQNGGWHMTRMNLNTFARHGVLSDRKIVKELAAKLRNKNEIKRARVFPYQLMVAYMMTGTDVPREIQDALQDAMEIAIENVPEIEGNIVVCPDVSGSMGMPVTGYRQGSSSAVTCMDVAALVASAMLRKNSHARVLPFENRVVDVKLNARDTVMTNAEKLKRCFGGGTNCSAPLAKLNQEQAKVDLVIMVSDNESWVDNNRRGATEVMIQWEGIKRRNPNAKLVCLDIAPYGTTQAKERKDILNIGGFSDAIFDTISKFTKDELTPKHWGGEIEKIKL